MVQTTNADNAYTAWGSLKCKSKLELSDDDLFCIFTIASQVKRNARMWIAAVF
jgi:hypothetical protein